MELNELLDDIKEDTDTLVPEEEVSDLSSEELIDIVRTTGNGNIGFKLGDLDSKVIDKFNNMYRRYCLKQTTSDLVKVDRSIAREAMATLPVYSKTDEAKLTTYPSAGNKAVLDNILSNDEPVVSEETEDTIRRVLSFVEAGMYAADDTNKEITAGINKLVELMEGDLGLVKPMVISSGRSISLLEEPMETLAFIDDTTLDYPKHAGVLTDKIKAIYLSPKFGEFIGVLNQHCGTTTSNNLSLVLLYGELLKTQAILSSALGNINAYKANATHYFKENNKELTGWVSDLVNSIPHVYSSCDSFNKLGSAVCGDDGVMALMIDLLEFLD